MFSNYTFSNSNLKKKFKKNLSICLYIYQNPKFHIPKILPHLSTLNPKSRLVNPKGISIFYPSLKVMVKVISVNIKSCIMNVVFVTIFNKKNLSDHINPQTRYCQNRCHFYLCKKKNTYGGVILLCVDPLCVRLIYFFSNVQTNI